MHAVHDKSLLNRDFGNHFMESVAKSVYCFRVGLEFEVLVTAVFKNQWVFGSYGVVWLPRVLFYIQ